MKRAGRVRGGAVQFSMRRYELGLSCFM
uniref:Uncharacterized protein n=1 Tax=Anguilla anguilla TaxID=7936 RepID=A0A0E9VXQ0_ANGAN